MLLDQRISALIFLFFSFGIAFAQPKLEYRTIDKKTLHDKLGGFYAGIILSSVWHQNMESSTSIGWTPENQIPSFREDLLHGLVDNAVLHKGLPIQKVLFDKGYTASLEEMHQYFNLWSDTSSVYWKQVHALGIPPYLATDPTVFSQSKQSSWAYPSLLLGTYVPGLPGLAAEMSDRWGAVMAEKEGLFLGTWLAILSAEWAIHSDVEKGLQVAEQFFTKDDDWVQPMIQLRQLPKEILLDPSCLKEVLDGLIYSQLVCTEDTMTLDPKESKVNMSSILLSLRLGENDFEKSVRWAYRLPGDRLLNGICVAGLMGLKNGYTSLPIHLTQNFVSNQKYLMGLFSAYDFIRMQELLMKDILFLSGGTVRGKDMQERWIVPEFPIRSIPHEKYIHERDSVSHGHLNLEIKNVYPLSYQFKAMVSDSCQWKFKWFFGDTGSDTSNISKHIYDEEGVYPVSCIAYQDHGRKVLRKELLVRAKRSLTKLEKSISTHEINVEISTTYCSPNEKLIIFTKNFEPLIRFDRIELKLDAQVIATVFNGSFTLQLQNLASGKHYIHVKAWADSSRQIVYQSLPFWVGSLAFHRQIHSLENVLNPRKEVDLAKDTLAKPSFMPRTQFTWDEDQLYFDFVLPMNQGDTALQDSTLLLDTFGLATKPLSLHLYVDQDRLEGSVCDTILLRMHYFQELGQLFVNELLVPLNNHVQCRTLPYAQVYTFEIPWSLLGLKPHNHQLFAYQMVTDTNAGNHVKLPVHMGSKKYMRLEH